MVVGILKEPAFDARVSMLPDTVKQLRNLGVDVLVERDAGERAFAANAHYVEAGATLSTVEELRKRCDIILAINYPFALNGAGKAKAIVGVYQPLMNPDVITDAAAMKASVFSLDMLPRTTRAQSMDVLSSQASIAGYKAVIQAASIYPRYFPMLMTAAGTIPPAKILVIGAGVAGLQAIATARRLGAVVEVFDTRPSVKEEVMSLGAKFIEVDGAADASRAGGYAVEQSADYQQRQAARIAESVQKADIVITTAQIPGRKAPVLITEPMVRSMRSGSVIMDLAAGTGGNTPFTIDNKTIVEQGVSIVGAGNLAAGVPSDASRLYGKNILNFLKLIVQGNELKIDLSDELVKDACIIFEGNMVNSKLRSMFDKSGTANE